MILESLITDGSKLTLDCAKATLSKGSKIEIPDEFYSKSEVQNAIKMGLIRIVGSPPIVAAAALAQDENRRKFRSAWGSKLTFECLKDYVDPGGFINIPESKLTNSEVQNAIAWGMLVDPAAPKVERRSLHKAEIDEIKVDAKAASPRARPAPAAKSPVKAKKISKSDDISDADSDDDGGLYKESTVIVPKAEQPLAAKDTGKPAPDSDKKAETKSRFDFLDIFEEESPGDDKG
jgi:hypothetical protein